MKDYLISLFIDNELDLDEKVEFVEAVNEDKRFKDETVELLGLEKLLQANLVKTVPDIHIPKIRAKKSFNFKIWLPTLAGFATATVFLLTAVLFHLPSMVNGERMHRFVIYQPEATQAEIMGTFTNWSPIPLKKIGNSGYWSITLTLPEGEHRYSYLVGHDRRIADPTILEREQDDFGGENSIIRIDV